MKQRTSFTKLIQLWGIILVTGVAVSITALDIVVSYQYFNSRADQMRTDYIARQKQMIKHEVDRVVDMINHEKNQSIIITKSTIKSRTYEAYAIAQNIYQQNKPAKSKTEIQQMIIDALRPVRFENGRGYYFATSLDGIEILFADKPEKEGSSLLDVQDARGQYVIKDMIEIVRQSGEGFYEYHWTKPESSGNDFKKISFIKRFEPYDWFIGTGLYVGDIEEKMQRVIGDYVTKYRFGKHKQGYVFILDLLNIQGGKEFAVMYANANRPDLVGKTMSDEYKDARGKEFRKEFLQGLRQNEECYVDYWYKKIDKPEPSPKTSYFKLTADHDLIVAAGVYLDDVETDIAIMHTELNNQIRAKIFYFTLIAVGIAVFFLFLFSRLNRRLKNDFNLFSSFFNRTAFSDEPIDRGQVQFVELDRMAKNANKMLADRIQAEKALRRSEAKFRGLVESSGDWIWEVNAGNVYTYASPQVETILGYRPDEVVGKTLFDLVPPEEVERIQTIVKDALQAARPIVTLENVVLHKDGRRIVLETSGVPVLDETGKVIGYRGVDRDITERKKTEEELQKMQTLKSIGTLAGGIAHDFNNILMGLFGNISLAKEKLSKDHPGFKSLEDAGNSMNRAIRLTRQLLTFAKGGAPVRETISLDRLVEGIVRFDLSGSNVKPVFEQADDLWPVEADKGQIQQVFSNLIINARQAMPDGGHLYITMENVDISKNAVPGLDPGKYIRITVADEGTGIDRKYFDRIFDPYFTTKHAGDGLGLATVYSIINKHGGCINVDSQLAKGTTFTLYLPVSESRQSTKTRQPAAERAAIKQTAKILVMDDEEMICTIVKQMLEKSGFSVKTASDGKQAIEMYKQALDAGKPFAVVIMDLTIPGGIGGKEAIKDILEIDPEARCIVSSGYADDPVMANYDEYGFSGIVAKPYTKSKLLEVLHRVLEK